MAWWALPKDPNFNRTIGFTSLLHPTRSSNILSRFVLKMAPFRHDFRKGIVWSGRAKNCRHRRRFHYFGPNGDCCLYQQAERTSSFESDGYSPSEKGPLFSFDAQSSSETQWPGWGKSFASIPNPMAHIQSPVETLFAKGEEKTARRFMLWATGIRIDLGW